jgi:hypothetical protein
VIAESENNKKLGDVKSSILGAPFPEIELPDGSKIRRLLFVYSAHFKPLIEH